MACIFSTEGLEGPTNAIMARRGVSRGIIWIALPWDISLLQASAFSCLAV